MGDSRAAEQNVTKDIREDEEAEDLLLAAPDSVTA